LMSTPTTEVSSEEFEALKARVAVLERMYADLKQAHDKLSVTSSKIAVSGPGPLGPGIGQPPYPWGVS
jgi:hypothetical protein